MWNPTKEAELASVSLDGTMRVWDVRKKECVAVVELGGRGLSVCWGDDGGLVVVGRGGVSSFFSPFPFSLSSLFSPSLPFLDLIGV